jgi:hypothetical protein
LKPPDVPWCESIVMLHHSPSVAEPAGTRPCIEGSGFDPAPHCARGVASIGGAGGF